MSDVNEPPQLSTVVTFKAVWLSLGEDKMKWGSVSQQWDFAARWLKVVVKALPGSRRLRRCHSLISLKAWAIWCGPYRPHVQSQHFSAADHKWKYTYSNMFWWEWLSLDDKLKDWLGTSQSAFEIPPAENLAREKILCPVPNVCKYIK